MALLNQGANYCKTPTDYVRALDVPLLRLYGGFQMVTVINTEVAIIQIHFGKAHILVTLTYRGYILAKELDLNISSSKFTGRFLLFIHEQVRAIEQA